MILEEKCMKRILCVGVIRTGKLEIKTKNKELERYMFKRNKRYKITTNDMEYD